MKKEYEQTLLLLNNSLHGHPTDIKSEEWSGILAELDSQAVLTLPAKYVTTANLPADLKVEYMKRLGMKFKNFHKVGEEQKRLFELFSANNIPAVVLKGYAAAMYYPNPEYRTLGDIDLIFTRDTFNSAVDVLNSHGYKQIQTLEDNPRHIEFTSPSGIILEPHYRFSSSSDSKANEYLDNLIESGVKEAEIVAVGGYEVSVLPELVNGLVLLTHINQHLGSGLGLRQIIDWMMYVENCMDNGTWENEFSVVAESLGLKKLALITTAACKKYLGLKTDITWADSFVDSPLVEDFMLYIMNHGNFGRKDYAGSKSTNVVRLAKNPIKFFQSAQRSGLVTWKATKKYPFLRPFAWIYQIIRWIRRGVSSGVKISDVSDISAKENRETEFLRELGVTRL